MNRYHPPHLRFLIGLIAGFTTLAGWGANDDSLTAMHGLVHRLLPGHEKSFIIETIPPESGRDVFEIESRAGKVVLRGNDGVALAAGLNWYLKYYCQCHYSLKSQQLRLPSPLPVVAPKIRRVSQDRWRYFLNYCCFGYSLAWYQWEDWEKLIDWMALNGINAPLSVTGQEAVWERTSRALGFTEAEVREFLAGPPYLPFGWMGCLDGWGGPLPKSWVARHAELQKRILGRERAFGMTPVLQGFTGHVPPATRTRFPSSQIHTVKWIEWETLLLDPLDPLFGRFAAAFLKEQRRLFGSDHLYAADTFIEMTPPSGETNFLAATARAIYQGMAESDPQATWVLQGWTFFNQAAFWTEPRREAFLEAVPNHRMLVLDLFCDVNPVWNKTRGFCGKPWAWCALQNFGDNVYLGGALNRVEADLPAARKHPLGAQLRGIGFVNEGLDYNAVVFDFLFEQAWRHDSAAPLERWLKEYSHRAYGLADAHAEAAWDALRGSVFTGQHQIAAAYTRRPSLAATGRPPYSNARLLEAWRELLAVEPTADISDAYRSDVVAVTRQVLGNYSTVVQSEISAAWKARDRQKLPAAAARFLELTRDVDRLLATRREYLLGVWLEDARRWGKTPAEKARLEWNARRVITMWGETAAIRDYSRREWSGMLSGFYLKRWEKFLQALNSALTAPESFNEKALDQDLQRWERSWASQDEKYPTHPQGDSVQIARNLWDKYHAAITEVNSKDH